MAHAERQRLYREQEALRAAKRAEADAARQARQEAYLISKAAREAAKAEKDALREAAKAATEAEKPAEIVPEVVAVVLEVSEGVVAEAKPKKEKKEREEKKGKPVYKVKTAAAEAPVVATETVA
jgi:hypothetical protein